MNERSVGFDQKTNARNSRRRPLSGRQTLAILSLTISAILLPACGPDAVSRGVVSSSGSSRNLNHEPSGMGQIVFASDEQQPISEVAPTPTPTNPCYLPLEDPRSAECFPIDDIIDGP